MAALYIIIMIVSFIGGFVNAEYKYRKMTPEQRWQHNQKCKQAFTSVMIGMVVGWVLAGKTIVNNCDGRKRRR